MREEGSCVFCFGIVGQFFRFAGQNLISHYSRVNRKFLFPK